MKIQFNFKGKAYTIPLIMRPDISAYNGLAVVKFPADTKPRLQLVSLACHNQVQRISPVASMFLAGLGTVRLSRSHKTAWIDDGYCHKLTKFEIIGEEHEKQ